MDLIGLRCDDRSRRGTGEASSICLVDVIGAVCISDWSVSLGSVMIICVQSSKVLVPGWLFRAPIFGGFIIVST